MSTIYILGASGFIGKKLFNYLDTQHPEAVKSVGRNDCDVFVDLEDNYSELAFLAKEGDFVVFLSSISSPDICHNQPELAYKVNVESSINLINILTEKGIKIIFSSSDVVFGKSNSSVSDNSTLSPFGDYGEMKAQVESAVLNNNLVKVVRFSYVLGLGDKYTSMLMQASSVGESIDVFDGFERSVVVIDDVLHGINKLIMNWNQISAQAINFSGIELISRSKITELFSLYVCNNLQHRIIEAPAGFWSARPKTIDMKSTLFSSLLERQPMSVKYKLQHWSS